MVTDEVKVTAMPGHTGLIEGVIVIPTTFGCNTVMVIGVEFTGFPIGHVAFEIS